MAVKILSVDDELPMESLMRQYFRREMRSGKYEFFFAHNGREALDVLNAQPDIEVILSDINMPGMDGLTLLTKVKEMRNPLLRVVMVSAYGDMKNIRQAMNKGAFDFATKPIDKDDLQQTIDNAIAEIEHELQLQKEHAQLESLKTDLNGARVIQQYILPRVFPPFPDLADKVDVYASMEAAKDIGGDFYDFFRIDDEHIAFTIADVCGKGIPAALFMAVSRTTIRSQAALHHDPAECLTESNRLLVSYSVDCMFDHRCTKVLTDNHQMACVTYEIAFSCGRGIDIPEPVLLVAEQSSAVQCTALQLMKTNFPVEADRKQPISARYEVNARNTAVMNIPICLSTSRLYQGGKD